MSLALEDLMHHKSHPFPMDWVNVLCVGLTDEDMQFLRGLFRGMKFRFTHAANLKGVKKVLARGASFPLLVMERKLSDGDWKGVVRSSIGSRFVVVDSHPNEALWDEVLSLGGEDVI